MLGLIISAIASAQKKMTIKTGNGQLVEISCEGITPDIIAIGPDGTVTFKLEKDSVNNSRLVSAKNEEVIDSIDTFVEVDSLLEAKRVCSEDSLVTDTLVADDFADSSSNGQTSIGLIANLIAEEVSPEYADFEKKHEGTHPASEKELVKNIAKKFLNEEDVENADLLLTLFKGLRDSSFIPNYEQRTPKPSLRTYNIIELSGSLGQNIEELGSAASKIDADDYGDDTENDRKYGGDIKYSRIYMSGREVDGVWKPNPVGFAWSWGGLFSYSYEKDIGSYVNIMGKVGMQIGQDICVGVDALVGSGLTPYNTFLSDDVNYNLVNKSAWCFKYGVQIWGSLNFSKDTYTALFGRYIYSVKPSGGKYDFSKDWHVVYEDFDPSSWTVGLAVGYKFGAPQPLSQDKRLQASLSTGYCYTGNNGIVVSAELERLTQVNKSLSLSYGIIAENVFEKRNNVGSCSGLLLSCGFQVRRPLNTWFWGAKLLGGVGEYSIVSDVYSSMYSVLNYSKRLCGKGAIQFNTGLRIGKCSALSVSLRAGYHFGVDMEYENLEEMCKSSQNLSGFDIATSLGYSLTF